MTYLEFVQRAHATWKAGEHGPYVCDNLSQIIGEVPSADYFEACTKARILRHEVFHLLRGASCVGQYLYPTRLRPRDIHLSEEEQEEARAFRESTLWPQLISAAKALDKQEGEPANG